MKIYFYIIIVSIFILSCDFKTKEKHSDFKLTGKASAENAGKEIWAIPLSNYANVGIANTGGYQDTFSLIKKYTINGDGSFNIDLSGDDDSVQNYAFVIADVNSVRKNQMQNFIGINDLNTIVSSKIGLGGLNSVEVMIKIPVENASGTLDLGLVGQNENDPMIVNGTGIVSDAPGILGVSGELFHEMACSDDMVKSIKNSYIAAEKNCIINTSYNYISATGEILNSISQNRYTYPDTFSAFHDYSVNMRFANSDEFAGADKNQILLIPPGTIQTPNGERSPLNPLVLATDSSFYYYPLSSGYTTIGISTLTGSVPAGFFTLQKAGVEVLTFDLSYSGITDSANRPKTLIPSLKITTENNIIKQIDVKFYYRSGNTLYEQKDLTNFLLPNRTVQLKLGDGSTFENGMSEKYLVLFTQDADHSISSVRTKTTFTSTDLNHDFNINNTAVSMDCFSILGLPVIVKYKWQ